MIEDYRDLEPMPEHGNDFIAGVSNCPDLTGLWFETNGKRKQGTITEDEAKKIYDALNTLEKHNLCQLKFGI